MNNETEKKSNIICINSIKGGAGKTTIALSLAYSLLSELEVKYDSDRLQGEDENVTEIQEPKVCYIDLDILGTGAKHIIYGENYIEDDIKYLNDMKSTDKDFKQYINYLIIEGKKFCVDCIILNDAPEEKNKFINNARSHTSTVNINMFQGRAKKLLAEIVKENIYDYIIIDCAPGYEGFSRNIYDYLKKEIKLRYNHVRNVYNLFITTLDKAHVMNTISFVYNIITATDNNLNIKIVLNDTLNYFDNEGKKEEFISNVIDKFSLLSKKEMEECGDNHNPSIISFNIESIVVKKYSDIALNMFFGNGKQLHGTRLCENIDDRELVKTLKILSFGGNDIVDY